MADGRETRATIDSETVKGLLLINGGGAVALLAFLPGLLQEPEFSSLSKAIIWAIFTFQCGLVFAVIHNRLRGLCSLEYANKPENRTDCSFFSKMSDKPCVCIFSRAFMWLSIVTFLLAGLIVLKAGLCHLNKTENSQSTVVHSSPNKALLVMYLEHSKSIFPADR